MIRDDQIPELSTYRAAEEQIDIASRPDLAAMVVFGGNGRLPVHSWFRFKEGFSSRLLGAVLSEFVGSTRTSDLTLLDPFCGVATTLLSAQMRSEKTIRAIGIERNPFIRFVACTKLGWRQMNPKTLLSDGAGAIAAGRNLRLELPALSSIKQGRCISTHIARRLIAIDHAAQETSSNSEFLRLGIASAIEPLSRIRRDGRALRIVQKERRLIKPFLEEIWASMAADVLMLQSSGMREQPVYPVLQGDGRNPIASGIHEASINLIVTSPPYPNNIDYSEVYKLELWLLGFMTSAQDFLRLRHSTFKSHPTFDKAEPVPVDFGDELQSGRLKNLLGGLIQRLLDSDESWRGRLLRAYFGDMWMAIGNYKKSLTKDGIAVLVVGNSLHGTDAPALVATDLILARIAECHGMSARIAVARGLRRRLLGNHFLRESIVVLKKT